MQTKKQIHVHTDRQTDKKNRQTDYLAAQWFSIFTSTKIATFLLQINVAFNAQTFPVLQQMKLVQSDIYFVDPLSSLKT